MQALPVKDADTPWNWTSLLTSSIIGLWKNWRVRRIIEYVYNWILGTCLESGEQVSFKAHLPGLGLGLG